MKRTIQVRFKLLFFVKKKKGRKEKRVKRQTVALRCRPFPLPNAEQSGTVGIKLVCCVVIVIGHTILGTTGRGSRTVRVVGICRNV